LAGAEVVFLRPVEIRLLPHLRAAFARRNDQRTHMRAVGFGTLKQCYMTQSGCRGTQRSQQVAQHPVIDADLFLITPAVHQARKFEQCRIDQMGHVAEPAGNGLTGSFILQVQRNEPRAMCINRLPPGQRDHAGIRLVREMLQRGISDQAGCSRDQNGLARHCLYPTRARSRSSYFWILPVEVFGSGPNTTRRGHLKCAIRSRQKAMMSASVTLPAPGFNVTKACGVSPHFSSGAATTAASITDGCLYSTSSTSSEEMFSPPEMMMSLARSLISA